MSPVRPANGEKVVEVKTTTIEPHAGQEKGDPVWLGPYVGSWGQVKPTQSQFMDWIEDVPAEEWSAHRIEITVNRNGQWIGKWLLPPFNNEVLRDSAGGGTYAVKCKIDGQIRFSPNVIIAGIPKDPEEVKTPDSRGTSEIREMLSFLREQNQMFMSELRAMRGGAAGEQAIANSVALGANVLNAAVPAVTDIVSRAANANNAPRATESDELDREFKRALIQRMLNPADPIEQFSKMLAAMQALGVGNSGGGGGWGEALVKIIPAATQNLATSMRAIADAKQADLRALEIMRVNGDRPPGAAPALPPAANGGAGAIRTAPVPANGHTQPAPQPAQPTQNATEPTPQQNYFAFIESRIVRVLMSDAPVDVAAEDVYNYLRVECPEMIDQLVGAGEEGLLGLFRSEPILAQVPQNPRLTEFVKKFIAIATETKIPDMPPPATDSAQPQPTA